MTKTKTEWERNREREREREREGEKYFLVHLIMNIYFHHSRTAGFWSSEIIRIWKEDEANGRTSTGDIMSEKEIKRKGFLLSEERWETIRMRSLIWFSFLFHHFLLLHLFCFSVFIQTNEYFFCLFSPLVIIIYIVFFILSIHRLLHYRYYYNYYYY